ncbi:MAG: DNA polymerase I [Acidobacteria bacterium]|nr:DNA polymerase I [Acidobacteriota bacterium]
MSEPRSLFLIDGSNQMYRAYHAIRGLTGPDGRSTNAVYGFVTMLRKLLADHKPTHIAASFDLPTDTFRDKIVADYKANRAPMPSDLAEQIPWVHEACEAMGVPILTSEGFEADDVIGTLAKKAAAAGFQVAIVTGDKDFFQLVDGPIRVYNPKDEGAWFDAEGVKSKFGVAPSQVVDVLALMGDTSDNVKGVPGIGEKGARDLITTYGSLDALLASAGEVKAKKQREALLAHGDDARQARQLVTIHTDVPVPFEPEALTFRGASRERCYTLFSDLGFRTLVTDYAPSAESVTKDYAVVESAEAVARLADEIRASGRVALHVLAEGDAGMRADVAGLVFATGPRAARFLPFGAATLMSEAGLDRAETFAALKPVLEDPAIAKVGHDLKFATVVLARHGITLAGLDLDTMLAAYLLDASRSSQDLEPLALEQLGYRARLADDVRGKGAKAVPFTTLAPERVLDYAGERADLAWQLAERFAPELDTAGVAAVYRDLELPLVPILAGLERSGVKVDTQALASQAAHMEQEMGALAAEIHRQAGETFNIGSPKQLGEILFDKLQLPVLKRTGTTRTPSTAVEVLEELALTHDLPRLILDWRSLSKLKGTYIDALPSLVHPVTGRVHTVFNQAVAATGRLSSSDPNLQNIPIRTALGREIRRAFVAEPGYVLISADYSQIELRVLAHLSGDETLTAAFARGDDIHDQTALKVFGPESGLDRHELRRRAKIVNYALLYGKTAFTLAKDIGVSQAAAQQFIDAYFAGFPRVRGFIEQTLEDGRTSGVVRTMFGRKRPVPELTSRNGQIRAAAERMAVNMPIQGTAADILKRAMIDVDEVLSAEAPGSRMILTVHDELLFEAPVADADRVAELVRATMAEGVKLSVPLDVDVGIGANWKEAKP